jgi:hypothetical protein
VVHQADDLKGAGTQGVYPVPGIRPLRVPPADQRARRGRSLTRSQGTPPPARMHFPFGMSLSSRSFGPEDALPCGPFCLAGGDAAKGYLPGSTFAAEGKPPGRVSQKPKGTKGKWQQAWCLHRRVGVRPGHSRCAGGGQRLVAISTVTPGSAGHDGPGTSRQPCRGNASSLDGNGGGTGSRAPVPPGEVPAPRTPSGSLRITCQPLPVSGWHAVCRPL